ncbi:Cilia- and flagella-associated protein 20 [Coemansia helicoidea]|uniref:Cilia- and flagella-associated protein 20 n=1 Tax=Coemansia helicoidea TaxID=1286919 RepID=A0ACC1L3C8_9FUNG|nr:Cilia- and flagella-associated protein 20 [Coemansia helicoidea]
MLRHVYHSGIVTVLNSAGSEPLQLWAVARGEGGHVAIEDDDDEIDGPVLCLRSADLRRTFVCIPRSTSETLGIKLPFLGMVVKNTGHLFTFEVEVSDSRGLVRRLRPANYESEEHIGSEVARLPLWLDDGWNYLTFDLGKVTTQAYGTQLGEVRRVVIHASACLRLVFFADRVVPEDELPRELRLHVKRGGGPATPSRA